MTHPTLYHLDAEPRPSLTRRDGLALLSLVLLAALFFWRLALTELIIGRGDVFFYFYPYRDYASAAARTGRVPLWNSHLFMGAPFLANSQAGFFYPLNLILAGLPVERLVNLTLVLHAALATVGAYGWGRGELGLSRAGAWLTGLCFGLGGYFSAQVEHVNQVQGLAWLPSMLWLYGRARKGIGSLGYLLGLAGTIGLAFLAGHMQSVFICLVGLAGYAGLPPLWRWLRGGGPWRAFLRRGRGLVPPVVLVLTAIVLGLGLAAVQLLPTWELSQLSVRGSGLPYNEAASFSLNPTFLGRALLPGWDETLFPEFVAHVGVVGLALAGLGLLRLVRSPRPPAGQVGALFLALLGLFLALGGYNPLYYPLVRFVPGFGLFRAPARWLALYGLGAAGLVGLGFDGLNRAGGAILAGRRWLWLPGGGLALALLVWGGERISLNPPEAARSLAEQSASGLNPALSWASVAGWSLAALVVAGVLIVARWRRRWSWASWVLLCLVPLELFGASVHLPFNRATAPGALTSLRPAVAHLLAEAQAARATSPDPPARFLSMSDIFFDPGDKPEIEFALGPQLSDQALYDYVIATKQKEVLIPNLPLYYQLPTADGYDGGVLPLRRYVTLERLFLPPEKVAIDGRLRENLDQAPQGRWLNLFNVRFLVTDKLGDAWFDDVFYDLQHQAVLGPGDEAQVGHVPDFPATALGVVYQAPEAQPGALLAEFELGYQDGSSQRLALRADGEEGVARLAWGQVRRPTAIRVQGVAPVTIRGLSLIDQQTERFQALVLSDSGRYHLVHSGDVKIYENLDVLPRAFFVDQAVWAPDDETALAAMQAPDFDPATTVVLIAPPSGSLPLLGEGASPQPSAGSVSFVRYEPERVALEVSAPVDGWLVLSDAWYPGWQARIDGEPAGIERADILFRAVAVPAGEHRVEFLYWPASFRLGCWLSGGTLLLLLLGGVVGWIGGRRRGAG